MYVRIKPTDFLPLLLLLLPHYIEVLLDSLTSKYRLSSDAVEEEEESETMYELRTL